VDRLLRHGTLVVLLLLAFVVWFEVDLFGRERGVLRVVVGVLCFYVAVQSLERQRLAATFKQVLQTFRSFHAGDRREHAARAAAAAEPSGEAADSARAAAPTAAERRQAVEILIAALRRGGSTADLALGNLERITGERLGREADAWQRWLDAQPHG